MYGYEVVAEEGNKALIFMPTSTQSPFQRGWYNPATKILILESKDKNGELKLVGKIDDFGEPVKRGGKQLVERRTFETPIQFSLKGEVAFEWIGLNTENKEYVTEKLKQYDKESRLDLSGSIEDGGQAVPDIEPSPEG